MKIEHNVGIKDMYSLPLKTNIARGINIKTAGKYFLSPLKRNNSRQIKLAIKNGIDD